MKDLIQKLRQAADALEALTQPTAQKRQNPTALLNTLRHSLKKTKSPHWTQTPEGKKKISRFSKRAWKRRRAKS